MQYLKQSTASQEISLGYFLDSTDGNTEETALTIANTDIKLRKGGTTTLANKNSGGATHISNGVYHATLDATDTNTLGMLEIYVHVAGALAVKNTYMVLPAASYDAIVTNGLNDISPAEVNTECDTALTDYDAPTNTELNARTLASADYFDASTDLVTLAAVTHTGAVIPTVTTTTTATNLTNLPSIPANWLTSAGIAASALDNKGNWNIGKTGYTLTQTFPANFADLSITASTGLVDITQTAADKAWSTSTRVLTANTNLNDISVSDVLTTQMTESYAADGVAPTLAQGIFLTMQNLQDFSFAGTTQTVKKIDGSTTAATYTLDDATNPTSKTRAT
jgi:hypothetical protein